MLKESNKPNNVLECKIKGSGRQTVKVEAVYKWSHGIDKGKTNGKRYAKDGYFQFLVKEWHIDCMRCSFGQLG